MLHEIREETQGFNNACRIGTLVLSDHKPYDSCFEALEILRSNGYPCNFDINHDNGGGFSTNEWVSQLRAFSVRYMKSSVHTKALVQSFYDNEHDHVIELPKRGDKYKLKSLAPCFKQYNRIVFIGGTNLIHSHMDLDKIDVILDMDSSVVIKPHPLTNVQDMKMLTERYGKGRVLYNKLNGIELLQQCERAWIPVSSEMWFTCAFLGIPYDTITKSDYEIGGTYYAMLEAMKIIQRDTKLPMNVIASRIITSPTSGIYTSMYAFKQNYPNFIANVQSHGGRV
ncbi:hypothetical protein VPHD480_0308 [Vibrio phage D480]|nr:hypothetical protein MYOV011v1_p0318 [Vibrio phage 6E35.1a]